jgi:hypothetical protein
MGASGSLGLYALLAGSVATSIAGAVSGPAKPKPPPVMPDQTTLLKEGQITEAKDAALRYGRAATVLTNPGGAGGSTGDKLGP